jgi:hypothetical protein
LKAFDALYAERHVTRAGSRIGLSHSTMSGALTRLRELLGDELFVRTPSGMQPTLRAYDLAGPFVLPSRSMVHFLESDLRRRLDHDRWASTPPELTSGFPS